jgi:hypothetical protein
LSFARVFDACEHAKSTRNPVHFSLSKSIGKSAKVQEQSADTILEAAMMLPEKERITLASRLLESVPSDDVTTSVDDRALIEELDRRFADREGGLPWSELRAKG